MRKKILLQAPLLTRSGYGEQSRFALRSLRTREDIFDIYITPLQWGQTSWITLQDEERKWIDNTIEKTVAFIQQGGQFDISLQVTIPNEWKKMAPVNIGYTAGIETSKVAPIWLQKANENMDKIIVVSNHSKNTYAETIVPAVNKATGEKIDYTLQRQIDVVGYPTKTYENLSELPLEIETDFNFLAIAQFGPRKNLNNTIKWFVEEFYDQENVGLVVKTNIAKNCLIDRERTNGAISQVLSEFPDRKCKVYLLHGDMTDEEIHSLYVNKKISAFLALPHGEGFGLPIYEAAYSGLPVVTVGWSGQVDYLFDKDGAHFYNVAYDMQQIQPEVVWKDVLIAESFWAYAREHSAKEQMRLCYEDVVKNNKNSIAHKAKDYAEVLHERYSADKMYEQFVECIYDEPQEIDFENWSNEQQTAQEID